MLGFVLHGIRSLSQGYMLAPVLIIEYVPRGSDTQGFYPRRGGQRHHGGLGEPLRKETGAAEPGLAMAGDPALMALLWGMLFAEDAAIVSQSSEQPRKITVVVVAVCAAFRIPISEANTEIGVCELGGCPMPPPHSALRQPTICRNKLMILYTLGKFQPRRRPVDRSRRRIRNA